MKRHYHFSNISMEDMIFELGAAELRKLSDIWKDFARRALCRARDLEEREKMKIRNEKQVAKIQQEIPDKIIRAIENGATYDIACRQIDAEYNAPDGFALVHWKCFIRTSNNHASCLRRQLIFNLASLGKTNGEISHSIGIHKNSVSRIIGQIKKERARTVNVLTR